MKDFTWEDFKAWINKYPKTGSVKFLYGGNGEKIYLPIVMNEKEYSGLSGVNKKNADKCISDGNLIIQKLLGEINENQS